ncbi:MAG: ABC transporter substrate-binding protein [Clostridiales Family XIII bacterium]|jgi:peptide/nickel transport system substrate-binding protein|nr:ABC transporter substrate-binding protein [Clostridiales Family XIII bacterium]
MKHMKRIKQCISLILALALVLGLAACSGKPAPKNDNAGAASTLVYGSGDYTAINPALYEHGEINSLLFLGLTRHDKDNRVVAGLAESWTWDDTSKSYTFVLKDGLTFHDGAPLTSADVKFTFEAIMDEANGSENISNYEDIVSIAAPDEKTVVFTLSAPNAAMPDYLTMGVLPKHLLDGKNIREDDFNRAPVGAGPYRFVSWDMGQSITMEKFDGFCLGAPKIDRVIFKIVEDYDARALQLKSGELDLAQVTPKDAEEFKSDKKFDVYDMATADYRGILYNFANPLWKDNPGLPAALSYAIDRNAVVTSVLLGQGQAAYSPLQKGEYNNPAIEKYEYDPQKAQAAIEALGWTKWKDGYYQKNGAQLAFAISVRPSDQVRVDMANICAQNLQDVGVNATVEINEQTDWAGQQAFLIGWGSPFDPDDHTYKVFGTNKGANYSAYSNAEVDRLLTEARASFDAAERLPLYAKFQDELARDPAYTFIAYIDALYVAKAGLTGITTDTVLGHHGVGIFWNVWEWNR